jgi:hypothetical protein
LSRYVQLRADFTADSQGGSALDFIEVDYGAPAAGQGILAQITPTQVQLGVVSSYAYILLPAFASVTEGFNRIDVAVPSSRTTLRWLEVDGLAWTRETPPEMPQPDTEWLDGLSLDGREKTFAAVVGVDGSRDGSPMLSVKMSTVGLNEFPQGQGRTIEFGFETSVFQTITQFPSWIWSDVAGEGVRQRADPGDASQSGEMVTLEVRATGGVSPGVRLKSLGPNPFSPNGDDINDAVRFHVQALSFLGHGQLHLRVHSLAGRAVRSVNESLPGVGDATLVWDGLDDAGRLCAPGLYIYRISVRTPQRELAGSVSGTIAVAY